MLKVKQEPYLFSFVAYEGLMFWKQGDREAAEKSLAHIVELAESDTCEVDFEEVLADVYRLMAEMKEYEKWEHVLRIMDERVGNRDEIYVQNMWTCCIRKRLQRMRTWSTVWT